MTNILIVKFGALGDVIRTSYILQGILRKYSDGRIFWLTGSPGVDLLRFNPYVSALITPEINVDLLKEVAFDIVISLDDEAEILRILEKVTYRELIGAFLNEKGLRTYDSRSSLWFDMGLISMYGKEKADMLKKRNRLSHKRIMERMLGIRIERPYFFNSTIIEERVKRSFDRSCFKIGINSGAGGRWSSKQLPVRETVLLIRKLVATRIAGKRIKVCLLGSDMEKERHSYILHEIDEGVCDTGSRNTLLELAAIIKCMDYVISSDSLALHLSISQNIPNLSFYAPTSANEIETFGTGVKIKSLAKDYCSYRPDADNSTITAKRIYSAMHKHIMLLGKNIDAV